MDLLDYDLAAKAEKGAELELLHPVHYVPFDQIEIKGEKQKPVKLTILGEDSNQFIEATRELGRMSKAGNELDPLEGNLFIYSRLITGWENIEENGEPLPFSQEKAFYVLKKYNWIAAQVKAFAEKRSNFFLNKTSE